MHSQKEFQLITVAIPIKQHQILRVHFTIKNTLLLRIQNFTF